MFHKNVYKFKKVDNLGCSWVAMKKCQKGAQAKTNTFLSLV